MNNPLVSIIIPTYNRAHLITETLDSIIAQTHTNWECIVVDDGSTDTTSVILEAYVKKDNRFQYHTRPNDRIKGANACRNYGFQLSKGEYVNWFDSDDLMHPEHLEKKVTCFIKNKKNDFVICKSQNFDDKIDEKGWESNMLITGDLFENYIYGKLTILTFHPMWRKSLLRKYDLFDETIKQNQDLELYSRIIDKENAIDFIDEVLIYVRENNESITVKNNKKQYHIASFLEVKRRILTLESSLKNKEILKIVLIQILKVFRYLIKEREYDKATEIIKFINIEYKETNYHKNLFKIKAYYYLMKNLKKGEFKFKKLLQIT
ncbi:glycosyltransferase family 2 protein [Polaribacter sp. L3A8]|uniref:glycosyltransferase family 2 protein n=1 Tax=Polaribacter sp. L3A8 TaxID=2686361 RepID=UPI001E2EA7D3|nr:glycosyltransferase family 2 protein [Polaribacter sp. L3A8]